MAESHLDTLESLKHRLRKFAADRDWDQFHSPKNLSMALSAEVAEIVEHFQWLTEEQSKNLPKAKLAEVETELADTLIYLIRLADKLDIDLLKAAQSKIEVKGSSVADALGSLVEQFPSLKPHLYNEENEIHPFVNIFIGKDNIKVLDGFETTINEDSELMIIPSIAGGK